MSFSIFLVSFLLWQQAGRVARWVATQAEKLRHTGLPKDPQIQALLLLAE